MLVLASCTQSKRGVVAPHRHLRHYSGGSRTPEEVGGAWSSALRRESAGASRLAEVYKGSYWSSVLALARRVHARRTLVVSAGLGLVDSASVHASYSATFSAGSPDSVPGASTRAGRAQWWSLLGGRRALLGATSADEPLLVVLPNGYLDVVAEELLTVPRERLLIFASGCPARLAAHAGESLIELDSRMVRELGTNVAALAPATASHVLGASVGFSATSELRQRAAQLIPEGAAPLYPQRRRQTLDEVRAWLRSRLEGPDPPGSATSALRQFRGSGRAFEQKRFHKVFHDVVGESKGAR